MKFTISQLITCLQHALKTHGDVPVLTLYQYNNGDDIDLITEIYEFTAVKYNCMGKYCMHEDANIIIYPNTGILLE